MSEAGAMIPHLSVEEECKRNPELKMSDLELLKDWMNKQPHLPIIETFILIPFLHSNYYSIEPTKKMIEDFFTTTTHAPEIFSNRDAIACKELRKIFNCVQTIQLEQKTKEGYTMILTRFIDTDPNKFNFGEVLKYMFMVIELHFIMRSTDNGLLIIFDVEGISFGHLAQINLMTLKKIVYFLQNAFPVRLKGIHILNSMPVIDIIIGMMKPFTKAELLNMIHPHTSLKSVEKYLPIEALPNDVGGKAESFKITTTKSIELLEKYQKWFNYGDRNLRVNESLRIGKCQTAELLFGVDGTFKKLEID